MGGMPTTWASGNLKIQFNVCVCMCVYIYVYLGVNKCVCIYRKGMYMIS
jgi:hypothetical protein